MEHHIPENYYTVKNAASRLNVCEHTIIRAIKRNMFTGIIKDQSVKGTPAYMIPSDQVEMWKDKGGILLRKSPTSKQEANQKALEAVGYTHTGGRPRKQAVQSVPNIQPLVLDVDQDSKKELLENFASSDAPAVHLKPFEEECREARKNLVNKWTEKEIKNLQDEMNQKLEDQGHLTVNEVRERVANSVITTEPVWQTRENPHKFTIEIDADIVRQSVGKEFRKQIENMREAINLINDELNKLEAML